MIRALLVAALLAGCAAEPPPLPPTAASTAPVVRRPPPARFDGRYIGVLTANPDRTRTCAKPAAQELLLTIQGGRGSFEIDPVIRQVLTGIVDEDGALRLVDRVDRTIATEGIFTDGTFLGEHRNGLCGYTVRLRKRD